MNLGTETDIGDLVDTNKFVDIDGSRKHTEEAIKDRGEVFTPTTLVNEMLDKLPPEVFIDPDKTVLDNSCGNGQFLAQVLKRKMDNGIPHSIALQTIYGVELDPVNAEECRIRLLMGFTHPELRATVDRNIITADALDPLHKGWNEVGFYWPDTAELNGQTIKRYNKNESIKKESPSVDVKENSFIG